MESGRRDIYVTMVLFAILIVLSVASGGTGN